MSGTQSRFGFPGRYYTQFEAARLGIAGFVRNEKDGSVYIEAEADEKILTEFLNWCRHGPKSARVDKVDYEYGDTLKNFSEFVID